MQVWGCQQGRTWATCPGGSFLPPVCCQHGNNSPFCHSLGHYKSKAGHIAIGSMPQESQPGTSTFMPSHSTGIFSCSLNNMVPCVSIKQTPSLSHSLKQLMPSQSHFFVFIWFITSPSWTSPFSDTSLAHLQKKKWHICFLLTYQSGSFALDSTNVSVSAVICPVLRAGKGKSTVSAIVGGCGAECMPCRSVQINFGLLPWVLAAS